MIRLTLSSGRPLNTVLSNEKGEALYVSKTPVKWMHEKTIIYHVQPDYANDLIEKFELEGDDDDGQELTSSDLGLTQLAEIHWQVIAASKLKYKGMEVAIKDFIHPTGILGLHHTFTASDGRPYIWKLGPTTFSTLHLERNDNSMEEVAHFHRSNSGVFGGSKRPAFLDIRPEVMPIIDDIVVTFLYCDKLRRRNDHLPSS